MRKVYIFSNGTRLTVEVDNKLSHALDEIENAEHRLEERERYHREYRFEACVCDDIRAATIIDFIELMEQKRRENLVIVAMNHLPIAQKQMLYMLLTGTSIRSIAVYYSLNYHTMLDMLEKAVEDLLGLIEIIE